MTLALAAVFAVLSGLAVGNIYWVQPVLAQVAADLGVDVAEGGALVTAAQAGYAAGILLIVPLGDVARRRPLVVASAALSAVALAACAAAPTFAFLTAALAVMGFVTVAGQILIPMAGDLADPAIRGRVVGLVTSGVTVGILVARLAGGLVAGTWGWRVLFAAAAVLNLAAALVMARLVPAEGPRASMAYPALLREVLRTFTRYRGLVPILLVNGLSFGIVFNLFWNGLTFLLSGAPFSMEPAQIGLVSLAGLVGAAASVGVGRLEDKGLGGKATGLFTAVCLLSMVLAWLAAGSVAALVVAAAMFSLGVQGVAVLNQSALFSLSDTGRSRLNTVLVVNGFVFSALGSALASLLWSVGGWTAVCVGACCASAVALAVWAVGRKGVFA